MATPNQERGVIASQSKGYLILRTMAVFQLILPNTVLILASSRENALGDAEYSSYTAEINSLIVGNYLTTLEKPFGQELRNFKISGYDVVQISME